MSNVQRITSVSNERIKQIRKLRDHKERKASGQFYLEGLRIVIEAVQQGLSIETLLYSPQLLTSEIGQKLIEDQIQLGTSVLEVTTEVFATFAHKEGPQGIGAVLRQNWTDLAQVHPAAGDVWVALDSVADPGNLGTILRTLDSVGGKGVILLDHSTDPYDPGTLRASMGALFVLRIVKTTFVEFADWVHSEQISVIGTSGAASEDYHTCVYPNPMILLMGSERQGLQTHHLELCERTVCIPMVGRSDSLNLAVATGVVLYEIFNQRRNS